MSAAVSGAKTATSVRSMPLSVSTVLSESPNPATSSPACARSAASLRLAGRGGSHLERAQFPQVSTTTGDWSDRDLAIDPAPRRHQGAKQARPAACRRCRSSVCRRCVPARRWLRRCLHTTARFHRLRWRHHWNLRFPCSRIAMYSRPLRRRFRQTPAGFRGRRSPRSRRAGKTTTPMSEARAPRAGCSQPNSVRLPDGKYSGLGSSLTIEARGVRVWLAARPCGSRAG